MYFCPSIFFFLLFLKEIFLLLYNLITFKSLPVLERAPYCLAPMTAMALEWRELLIYSSAVIYTDF